MKLLFVDVETTGLDPKENGIVQLSGIVEIDDKQIESFNYHIAPFQYDKIDDKALEVNRFTHKTIESYDHPIPIQSQFKKLFLSQYINPYNKDDKFHFIGYNARFDADFIRAWFEKCGDRYFGSWFFFPPIDVMNLAALRAMEVRHTFKDFKLSTVTEFFEVEVDEKKAHDALYDIEITRLLYYKLRKELR